MKTKLVFHNDFHGTETVASVELDGLSAAQRKRIRKALCPAHETCKCGFVRGPQDRLVDDVWAGFAVPDAESRAAAVEEYLRSLKEVAA